MTIPKQQFCLTKNPLLDKIQIIIQEYSINKYESSDGMGDEQPMQGKEQGQS